jgi:AI-2 transport protein TqsA
MSESTPPGDPAKDVPPPVPPSGPMTYGQRVNTTCLVVLAVCAAGTALTLLEPVITPVLIGLFLFFLVNPFVTACEARRVSTWLAYALVLTVAVAAVYSIGWVIDLNSRELVARLPLYSQRATAALDQYARLARIADDDGHFDWERYSLHDVIPLNQEDVIKYVAAGAVEVLEVTTLAVFYLLFLLIEARKLPVRVRRSLQPETAARVMTMTDRINADIRRYLVVKTAVSAGLGFTTAMTGLVFGLDFWPLWGFLMFLSNYITYIGSIVMLAPPILIAFVQFDSPAASMGLAATLALARFIWIDYVELRYSGKHVNVSPLLLLFGIALLGWMWGVVGMLLAVPLITSVRIALVGNPETVFLARLMSDVE